MSLQFVEREKLRAVFELSHPQATTTPGFNGATLVLTAVSGSVAIPQNAGVYAVLTNTSGHETLGGTFYAGADEYNEEFVKSILAADAAEPEARFNNVVDMLEWLDRK
jgi:hypothetical protein